MRNLTREELKGAVEAAHERGTWIRAHVNYADQVLECIEAGIDLIDHADDHSDACIEAMVKHGTYYCPTIGLTIMAIRWDKTKPILQLLTYYPKDEAYITKMAQMLQRAQKAGVKMLIGDDYGPFHGFLPDYWGKEINMFVDELHFDPASVIPIVTSNGARFFGEETGVIAPGKLADLLVLNFDPLKDGLKPLIDPEANILGIMKGGVFVKNIMSGNRAQAAA
jgi:imidazolonepropionase-like amidohydrolase